MYLGWLKEDRIAINIPIDEIYCKHETVHDVYRNNYRNQLKGIKQYPEEYMRNKRLTAILGIKGDLYPIALYQFKQGYMCVDGHHRIKAYLTLGRNVIPGLVYTDKDEALRAKEIPYEGTQK